MSRFFVLAATLFCLLFTNNTASAQQNSDSVILSQMRKLFYGMKFNDIRNDALVTIKDMPKDSPVLIIYFKTDCGHCRLDAERMNQLAPAYKIPIWMASYMDKAELQTFSNEFKLDKIKNLRVLHDFSKGMHNWFDFKYVPFIVLVDGKGNFIKEFNVLPSPEELEEVIRTNDFLEMYQK
ncbi:peroxiredoxin family protein [Edaphocola flava]|uniref:peroxiredoxin family protein n=1 Tax=Edaphocola flava TaxID=2499629 RepID=UPI00100A968F|nr:redoxin domain-containing protein [Edaphocola flava]